MTERTPGPWSTRIEPDKKKYEQRDVIEIVGNIEDGILDPVAELVEYEDGAIDAANAAFIVRACNAHDQLLEALQKLATFDISDGMSRYEMKEIARTAVKDIS